MEENTMEQTTQAENMGETATEQEIPEKGKQKLFTQEEVNSFVKSQAARMVRKATRDLETEYNRKLADLQAREMKLLIKERLSDRGMPKELADIISCEDEADIDAKLEVIQKIYGTPKSKEKEEQPTGFVQIGAESTDRAGVVSPDPVRKAMGL